MSERGSIITEYIYCPKCHKAAKRILLNNDKYLNTVSIQSWIHGDEDLPIIAGKVGGMYAGEELVIFEQEYVPQLEESICHNLRVAVLGESGEKIFTIKPKKG